MKIKINSYKIHLHETIEDLPITNYNRFNEYVTLSAGVGSNVNDVESHLRKITTFAIHGKYGELMQERGNMYQCIWNCLRGNSYELLQLLALSKIKGKTENELLQGVGVNVKANNKKASEIMSDINELLKPMDNAISARSLNGIMKACELSRVTLTMFIDKNGIKPLAVDLDALNELKNDLKNQLHVSFPQKFNKTGEYNYYGQLKSLLKHQLNYIIDNDETRLGKIKVIEDYFISLMRPDVFDGASPENIIIKQKIAFEKLCTSMMQRGISNPDAMTVLKFNSALQFFEEYKPKQKVA